MQIETVTLDLKASLPYVVRGIIAHVTMNLVEFDIFNDQNYWSQNIYFLLPRGKAFDLYSFSPVFTP